MTSNDSENNKMKMKRNKFFLYSGAAAIGLFSIIKNPFKLLSGKTPHQDQIKDSSIKITQNPNAVSRNTTKSYNG